MDQFIFNAISSQSAKEEQRLREIFRDKFHADMYTLMAFAPEDFTALYVSEARTEYRWCGKLIAAFVTKWTIDGFKVGFTTEVFG